MLARKSRRRCARWHLEQRSISRACRYPLADRGVEFADEGDEDQRQPGQGLWGHLSRARRDRTRPSAPNRAECARGTFAAGQVRSPKGRRAERALHNSAARRWLRRHRMTGTVERARNRWRAILPEMGIAI